MSSHKKQIATKPFPHTDLIITVILIAAPLLVFFQCTSHGFVWDDQGILFNCSFLKNPSLETFIALWTAPYTKVYTPFPYLIWAGLKSIGQSFSHDPTTFLRFLFHLASILLHIVNGFLVFHLLRLLVPNKWPALGGTLLFLIHPIQVEAVSWAFQLHQCLCVCLGLGALHLFLKARKQESLKANGSAKYYVGAFVLFVFATLSKAMAVTFVLFAIILDRVLFEEPFKKTALRILPWVLVIIPIALVTASIQGDHARQVSIWIRPFIWMDAVNFYLYKIANPTALGIYGRTPQYVASQWWSYLGWILPLALGYMIWWYRASAPVLAVAFLFFITGFLPNSGLLPFNYQDYSTVADRYVYLSLIGVSLAFSYGLSRTQKTPIHVIAVGYIIFLAVLSAGFQVPVWTNHLSLWTRATHMTPVSYHAHYNRGTSFYKKNALDKALEEYNKAIKIDSNRFEVFYNRGNLYFDGENFDKALEDFGRAIGINPNYSEAYNARGIIFAQRNEFDKALKDYNKAIEINPNNSQVYNNRGLLFSETNEYEKALRDYNRAIGIDPQFVNAYYNRAKLYHSKLNNPEKASKDLKKAKDLYHRSQNKD